MYIVNKTLEERGSVYGDFSDIAYKAQTLKNTISQNNLNYLEREALDMILHKIARLTNIKNKEDRQDSWIDIAGYANLVIEKFNQEA